MEFIASEIERRHQNMPQLLNRRKCIFLRTIRVLQSRVAVSPRHMLLLLPLFIVCPPISNWMRACQNKMAFSHDPRVSLRSQLNSPFFFLTTIIRRRSRSYTAVILSPLLFVKSALRRPGVRVRSLKWIMDLIMRQCSRNKFQWLLRLIVKWTKRREVKNEEPSSIVGSICGAFGMQHGMICPPPVHRQNNCKSLRMILCIGYIQEEATLKRIRTRTKLIQIESVHSV